MSVLRNGVRRACLMMIDSIASRDERDQRSRRRSSHQWTYTWASSWESHDFSARLARGAQLAKRIDTVGLDI